MSYGQPNFSPLDFFNKELQSESSAQRVIALKKAKYIAHALGAEDTRKCLFPIILELMEKTDSDEMLHAIAELLPDIANYLGPSPECYLAVLPPLESLMTQEETIVRDRAVQSTTTIFQKIVPMDCLTRILTEHFLPIVERLAEGEWFTSRISACYLIPLLYKYAPEADRKTLLGIFKDLCEDETPMVERAASRKLSELASVCNDSALQSFLVPCIMHCWKEDTHDAVRVGALSGAMAIARRLSPSENLLLTVPLFVSAAEQGTWKIRLTLVEHFNEIFIVGLASVDQNVEAYVAIMSLHSQLIQILGVNAPRLLHQLSALLQDSEDEIRTASLSSLEHLLPSLTPKDVRDLRLVEIFKSLANDSANNVRVSAANIVVLVACVLKDEPDKKLFLPVLQQFMQDPFPYVRLNIVCHTDKLLDLFEFEVIGNLLVKTVTSLMTDPQRRVRLETVNQLPLLARTLGLATFHDALEPLYFTALSDGVYTVRQQAVCKIENFGELFGSQWVATVLLPQLLKLYYDQVTTTPSLSRGRFSCGDAKGPITETQTTGTSYLVRITVLYCVPGLVRILKDQEEALERVLVLLDVALHDKIANVRFCAVQMLKSLSVKRFCEPSLLVSRFKPKLERLLANDEDIDVQYFVKDALPCI